MSEEILPEAVPEGDWQQLNPPLPPVGILSNLNEDSLTNLAPYGQYITHQVGTVIIEEGAMQAEMYILCQGKLQISALVSGQIIPLSEVEAGECIGEVSLLEPGPASASVSVSETATIWTINLESLYAYLQNHIGGGGVLLMGVAQVLSQRLRQVNQTIAQHHVSAQPFVPSRTGSGPLRKENSEPTGFFDKLKMKMSGPGEERRAKISTDIKL